MLDGHSFVPHYPWDDSAERASLAFSELRRASAVERECFASYWACRDRLERQDLSKLLQESQRVWQLASREYMAALSVHIVGLRAGVDCAAR